MTDDFFHGLPVGVGLRADLILKRIEFPLPDLPEPIVRQWGSGDLHLRRTLGTSPGKIDFPGVSI